jgi:alpha-galactosidase
MGIAMDCFRIDTHSSTLVVACSIGSPPSFLYWGAPLPSQVDAKHLIALAARQGAPGTPDVALPPSLAMEPGLGFGGPIGFSAHRLGKDWGSIFLVTAVTASSTSLHLICKDAQTELQLDYRIVVDPLTGTFTLGTVLTNSGTDTLDLVEMATACLPVPQSMHEIIGFTGRWAYEFHRERISRFSGTYLRENRRGRTSHDSFPALILCDRQTTEANGQAYGFHLAWSGNHRLRVDSLYDGRVFVSLGALLLAGELRLEAGARFVAPDIVASYSGNGLSGLSGNFHTHVRSNLLRASTRCKPRPVHYNTWEAVYFNHDLARLKLLATKAAELGVERFVLDDGWFGARRHDKAGLGDWVVSRDVYPQGLKPLVDHVTGLGMEMGIWFEPEMVNPDSDLFRAHPDWVLGIKGTPQVAFRGQLVLDIARREVSDYLFAQIDAVLSENDIGYIKWDMNRDHNHPGNHEGFPASLAQVRALYELLDRVRHKHPHIEIESCASGGGRADYGVLAHTDRVWTSDSNDAIDRQAIQRGASHFLPLEVMGAHVGPRRCHITGRTLSMAIRAGTAIMGHMGLELNLFDEKQADLDELKSAIALYKNHRDLLHSGTFVRLDTPTHLNCVGVICVEQTQALFSVAYLKSQLEVLPDRVHFLGLNAQLNYRIQLVWPHGSSSSPVHSIVEALDLLGAGAIFSGAALIHLGLQLPLCKPETVLLFYVQAVSSSS